MDENDEKWECLDIVLDSGAAESVAPESMAAWIPTVESAGSRRGQTYLSASGDDMPNKGEKCIPVTTEIGHETSATFQITDVSRPLCSVAKVCDQGNTVVFDAKGGYIEDAAGFRTPFKRESNVYVMQLYSKHPSKTDEKPKVANSGFPRQTQR